MMLGAISTWDVMAHPLVTVRAFGWRVFFRALTDGGRQTFLSILEQSDAFAPPPGDGPEVVGQCIELERAAEQAYLQLAARFAHDAKVAQFFADLADQEADHAELLQICQRVAQRGHWHAESCEGWAERLAPLAARMRTLAGALDQILTVEDAVALVLELEGSEVNRLFCGVLRATEHPFVRRLRAFRAAVDAHYEYIGRHVARLAPRLAIACEQFQRAHALRCSA